MFHEFFLEMVRQDEGKCYAGLCSGMSSLVRDACCSVVIVPCLSRSIDSQINCWKLLDVSDTGCLDFSCHALIESNISVLLLVSLFSLKLDQEYYLWAL